MKKKLKKGKSLFKRSAITGADTGKKWTSSKFPYFTQCFPDFSQRFPDFSQRFPDFSPTKSIQGSQVRTVVWIRACIDTSSYLVLYCLFGHVRVQTCMRSLAFSNIFWVLEMVKLWCSYTKEKSYRKVPTLKKIMP